MYDAFAYFCDMLSDKSVLFIPHLSDKLLLQTDASSKGIGAVLSVVRDGQELPIGYFSKKLKKAEQNYAATELECLAVIRAIDHFAVHLSGRPFTVLTECSPRWTRAPYWIFLQEVEESRAELCCN